MGEDGLGDPRESPRSGRGPDIHSVFFYTKEDYPAERVASHLHGGLLDGNGGLVLVPSLHREAIASALGALGVECRRLCDEGRLVFHDAEAIARALRQDPSRVRETLLSELRALCSRYTAVCVYGEVVDVLARAGDHDAAVELECWWNEAIAECPARVLCGYPFTTFADANALPTFRRVCDAHGEVESMHGHRHVAFGRVMAELDQVDAALRSEVTHRRRIELQRERLQEAQYSALQRAELAARRLERLQGVTSALAEVSTTAELGTLVATKLAKLLAADATMLALSTGNDHTLRVLPHDHESPPSTLTSPDGPMSRALRTGQSLWFSSHEALEQAGFTVALPEGTQSVGLLPLRLNDERLGVLALMFAQPYAPEAAERALLDDCVSQIALALARVRSFEEAQNARRRLQLLVDAAKRIAYAKLDLEQVLTTIVHEVTNGAFADGCALNLRADDRETLPLAAFHHVDPTLYRQIAQVFQENPVRIGEGIVGRVAQSGEPIRIESNEELLEHTTARYREPARRLAFSTLLAVPIRASGAVIGTLTASRQHPRPPFTADDEQLLQELADRASLSVENALLYERAQRERERAERAHQRAQAASRAKDEFLAMLGHELRNPLSPILTAVELMRLRGGDHLVQERTIIERQVNHMVRLVDDLLDVSRVARGKVELKRVPVELGAIVAGALEIASPLLEQRGHRVSVDVPSSGLLVHGDSGRLVQVVGNLLTNAAKYTPNGGTVDVVARIGGGMVSLVVEDSGIGIDPELLPRIFDLFSQGRQEIDRAHGGLGLGLAIAMNLTQLHGGSLRVESEGAGKGSRFTIELPLLEHPGELAPSPVPAHRPITPHRRARILVVDDNVDAACVLEEILGMTGHTIQIAHDGPSALEVAESFCPQLAVLDIGLPAMDGYELAERLRMKLGPNLRLVALTGYGQPNDQKRSAASGFSEHLVKPVDVEQLKAVIARLLASPSA